MDAESWNHPTLDEFKAEHLKPGYLDRVDPKIRRVIEKINGETDWAVTYGSCEGHATIHKEGYIAMIVRDGEIWRLIHALKDVKNKNPHTPMRLGINWDPSKSDSLSPEEVPLGWTSLKFKFFTLHLEKFLEEFERALDKYK
ncbi:MAG: hypothetical protein ACTSU5_07820 [Promethearchaeota archaeon]